MYIHAYCVVLVHVTFLIMYNVLLIFVHIVQLVETYKLNDSTSLALSD